MTNSAHYRTPEHSEILAIIDGREMVFPADPANRHYRLLIEGDPEHGIDPTPIADYALPEAPPVRLPKLLVIDRLQQAGKFVAALEALKANDLMYQRWLASQSVNPEDGDVLGLLALINADVDKILAPA